jgi:2-C-methyl-D-erythritol 2,4-cyclodiphosphate synthase
MVHVGIGYDVHPLVAGRKLVLGGVDIPHPKGLDGHSDADVLMHAICDAVLGALGEGRHWHFFSQYRPALARRGQQSLFARSRPAGYIPQRQRSSTWMPPS